MFSSGKVVELFYDVVSPYSWLAFEMLCRYRNVWNIDLKFKPAYLAGVIYGSGNQPAGMNPIPMFRPSDLYDKDTLNAMRFACWWKGWELWKRKWRTHQDITQPASLTEAGLKAGLSDNVVEEIVNLSTSQPIRDKLKSVTLEALKHKVSAFCLHLCTLCLSHQNVFVLKKYHKMSLHISSPFLQCFGFPFIVCHVNGKVKVFFASDRFELMAYFIGNYN
uniref:DSBA-like thioredoxin domain-containing protein n=1 Tax=Sinocyclocheilus grahami TaxID=75366 RepID=A0A672LMF0_SINGR